MIRMYEIEILVTEHLTELCWTEMQKADIKNLLLAVFEKYQDNKENAEWEDYMGDDL